MKYRNFVQYFITNAMQPKLVAEMEKFRAASFSCKLRLFAPFSYWPQKVAKIIIEVITSPAISNIVLKKIMTLHISIFSFIDHSKFSQP